MEEGRTEARDVPVDRRASDLGIQLEQVNLTLQQLRQTHDSLHEMEVRLADMTRECAGILDRWAKNDEKHASAVVELHGRLSEWNDIERRLLSESATRVHQFERSLQHEWNALKQKHEGPLQQLEAQSTRIAETCLTAVDQALRGFDKAEARLAALEQELQREMGELAREVRGALAELRQAQEPPQLGGRQPWSLENVVRLHNELRADADDAPSPTGAMTATGTLDLAPAPVRAPRIVEPGTSHDAGPGEPASPAAAPQAAEPTRFGRVARVAAVVLVLAGLVAYGLYLREQVSAGLRDAAARAAAAERDAAASRDQARQEIAAVQQTANERLATAQETASTAQRLAALVAAPDLKRFSMRTGSDDTPRAQVLWSRSQGVAFSAAELPAPPPGRAYQLWLQTRTSPASVGVIAPGANGPASAVYPWPANLRRTVVGAMVTIEPAGGSDTPTGSAWLSSPALAPPVSAAPTPTPATVP